MVEGFIGATYPQAADIASVEILKDASATAIYGSRGANGVIMVTTKKGRKGKMAVEINSAYTAQNVSNTLNLLMQISLQPIRHLLIRPTFRDRQIQIGKT